MYLLPLLIFLSSSSPCLLLLSLPPTLPRPSPIMERIRGLGIDLNALTSEYLPVLVSLPLENSLFIREELFKSATTSGLATYGDTLVSRRDTIKNPLHHKLADDITSVLHCLPIFCFHGDPHCFHVASMEILIAANVDDQCIYTACLHDRQENPVCLSLCSAHNKLLVVESFDILR